MGILLDAAVPVLDRPAPPRRRRLALAPRRRPSRPLPRRLTFPWAGVLACALTVHLVAFWKPRLLNGVVAVLVVAFFLLVVRLRRTFPVATRRVGLVAWALAVAGGCLQLALTRAHLGVAGAIALAAFGAAVCGSGASLEVRDPDRTTVPFPIHLVVAFATAFAFHTVFVNVAPPVSGWG